MKKFIATTLAVVGTVATLALYAIITVPNATQLFLHDANDQAFLDYCAKYGKSYATTEEFEFRKQIFVEKFNLYDEHNQQNDDATFTLGVNQFTDMTQDEYQRVLGFQWSLPL